ncbi:MAG: DNA internalization-related competence protein ComEC/Rec2 [Lachnospiraceae bacterium]|nr:DNA internalization-related competence protein ComEC/Rec2 [Lachnospiraceae bacterium]
MRKLTGPCPGEGSSDNFPVRRKTLPIRTKRVKIRIRRPVCLFSLLFVLFLSLLTLGTDPVKKVLRFSEAVGKNTGLTVTGTIVKIEYKNGNTVLTLSDITCETKKDPKTRPKGGKLIIYLKDDPEDTIKQSPLRMGASVKLKGTYVPYDPAYNTGNYDALRHNSLRGIYGKLTGAEVTAVSAGYSHLRQYLFELRENTKRVYEHYLSETEAGTLSALVLGDRTELSDEIKTAYQNASISHILSLSGLHIATIGLMLLRLLKRTGLNPVISSVTASGVMICYGIMTGMSVSTVRALIMFLMGVAAELLRRTYDLISAASLSAVLILISEPYYLYDTGFLLSFSAVMGINYVYPFMGRLFKEILKKCSGRPRRIKKLFDALTFSLSIQLSTLPVTMYSFSQITLSGIFANLIVIPLMTVLLSSGLILAFFGHTAVVSNGGSLLYTVFDRISGASAFLVHLILGYYEHLTGISGKIPHNIMVCGMPSIPQAGIYYIMLTILIIPFLSRRRDRTGQISPGISLLVLSAALFVLSFRSRAEVELHTISVGQGDCTLICGRDTPVILMDGGSTDIKNVGKYRIVPCLKAHGISHIDMVFISHLDSDHVNGVIEMLEDDNCVIKIGKMILSACVPLSEHIENYNTLIGAAKHRNIPVYLMDAGERLSFGGGFLSEETVITALSPDIKGSGLWKDRDLNDNSLVLKYDHGSFSALFTGDISSQIERELDLPGPVTYLKCAHHGSKTASSADFIKRISPEVTMISCGIDNSYGHPHKETLETLYGIGTRVYRTDKTGEITFELESSRSPLQRGTFFSIVCKYEQH